MGFDLKSARHWAEELLRQAVGEGGVVVDATLGNGYDTQWLGELVGKSGRVYGFDVQSAALEQTRARLEASSLADRADLFLAGHERVREFVKENVDAAVFNLGWLPGSDRSVRTLRDTTIKAAEECLLLLKEGGLMTICVYPGHDEGKEELDALMDWAARLDPRGYDVMLRRYLNQPGDPPVLIAVKKNLRRGAKEERHA